MLIVGFWAPREVSAAPKGARKSYLLYAARGSQSIFHLLEKAGPVPSHSVHI